MTLICFLSMSYEVNFLKKMVDIMRFFGYTFF